MSATTNKKKRVLSGMRATGRLHLGNYHGALKNWIKLQDEHECFFCIADWHALTTDYDDTTHIKSKTMDMLVDWLAVGISPDKATIFIQSHVKEHAELNLLLSMITPLSWLTRVPTYKDQQEKLSNKDLSTYGFLGYPVLQSADILLYQADFVPVGEDQAPHIELTRSIARRFNNLYQDKNNYDQDNKNIEILKIPEIKLTETPKLVGLDGQKMSKSYNNTIGITEDPKSIESKLKKMITDPARVKRSDPGEPTKCPVWDLHKIYSDDSTKTWVQTGCRSASIGCIDCKKPLIDSILKEQAPILERHGEIIKNKKILTKVMKDGRERAQDVASKTLKEVKQAMELYYEDE